jgi:hypothetical protein
MNTGIGRFQTMDRVYGEKEDPLSLHKYVFTDNDPIDQADPNGLFVINQPPPVVETVPPPVQIPPSFQDAPLLPKLALPVAAVGIAAEVFKTVINDLDNKTDFYQYVTVGKLQKIQNSGFIQNFDQIGGDIWFTLGLTTEADEAQEYLALPIKPMYRLTVYISPSIFYKAGKVEPQIWPYSIGGPNAMLYLNGGGNEFITKTPIPKSDIISIDPLNGGSNPVRDKADYFFKYPFDKYYGRQAPII